jgi:hypothetical protein
VLPVGHLDSAQVPSNLEFMSTITTPSDLPNVEAQRQRQLLDVLNEISRSHPFRGIDPVAWQREMREDVVLPFAHTKPN